MPSAPAVIRRRDATFDAPFDFGERRKRVIIPAPAGAIDYVLSRTLTVGGNAPSRPRFTLTFPATDYGVSEVYIVNRTATPNQRLTVRRTFSPAEQLIVDSDLYTVQVSGSTLRSVEFSGAFPLLDPRAGANNVIEWHVWATSVPTLTPQIDWTARWLN